MENGQYKEVFNIHVDWENGTRLSAINGANQAGNVH